MTLPTLKPVGQIGDKTSYRKLWHQKYWDNVFDTFFRRITRAGEPLTPIILLTKK